LISNAAMTATSVFGQDRLKIPDSATAKALDDKTVSLADHRGKLIFLVIWKTDCVACVFEIPILNKLHNEHYSEDFTVIGLSMDRGKKERVERIVEEYRIDYPVWLGHGESISAYTDVPIVPVLLVIGPDGWLAGHFIGAFYSLEHAEAALKEARAIIEKSGEGE